MQQKVGKEIYFFLSVDVYERFDRRIFGNVE